MAIILAVIGAVTAFAGLLRDLLTGKARAEERQAGRDEVGSKVNAETVETKEAMDNVPRPTDDAVSDSLRSGKF